MVCDLEGHFLDQIGGNGPALRDGAFAAAALNRPQGVAYSARRDCLYVADTENNALREVRPAFRCSLQKMHGSILLKMPSREMSRTLCGNLPDSKGLPREMSALAT